MKDKFSEKNTVSHRASIIRAGLLNNLRGHVTTNAPLAIAQVKMFLEKKKKQWAADSVRKRLEASKAAMNERVAAAAELEAIRLAADQASPSPVVPLASLEEGEIV